jgi:ankyrin repeat protein
MITPAPTSEHPVATSSTTYSTLDPSELPTEALDLAAKLFDYARQGDTTSLSQYLTAGIPSNLTNHEGNTLLMLAAYNGQSETVKLLLEKKADANVLNGRGQSPIAGAVFKGYDEIVKLLVDAGADVRLGQPSAVDAAKMFRRAEALKIMGIKQ